ncbi:hypothetical protein FB480_102349 [Agrobacterium vitis]|nr:hypothetical protein FB480_102349 [Agrobacterium vitis]
MQQIKRVAAAFVGHITVHDTKAFMCRLPPSGLPAISPTRREIG